MSSFFAKTHFAQKELQTQTLSTKKLRKTLLNKKADRKIIIKLTPGDLL